MRRVHSLARSLFCSSLSLCFLLFLYSSSSQLIADSRPDNSASFIYAAPDSFVLMRPIMCAGSTVRSCHDDKLQQLVKGEAEDVRVSI